MHEKNLDVLLYKRNKMKLYKKSQETVGTHMMLIILILLAVLIVVGIIIWQSGGVLSAYLDKIFG